MAEDPRALLQKADKALASAGSGFSFFGGREEKYHNAVEMYMSAANAFRMQKMKLEAGQAFEKASDVQKNKLSEPDDAANSLIDAFKAYRQVDNAAAERCVTAAIAHYCARGNFRRAASYKQSLGEMLEEVGDFKGAAAAYNDAAGWYDDDNAPALASKLHLKVGEFAALDGDYAMATDKFEAVAKTCSGTKVTSFSVKDHLLRAGICHLATGDWVSAQRAIENYDQYDMFVGTRERMLLRDLLQAAVDGDADKFTENLYQYDQVSKLDKWKTTLLLQVKNAIATPVGGDEGDDEFA